MESRSPRDEAQSFRELLQATISDPKVDAVLIGENHGKSFTPAAILANIDVLEKAGRKVIFVAEELEQHANQSPQAMRSALAAQDIKFTDANLYQTLNQHGITVLGGESKESSPLYGLTGKEREAKGLSPETAKQMSGMQRIANGNEAFSNVINQAIKDNPGAVVVFVGGATHPTALEKNGVTDPGMQGRIPNSVTINLVKTMDAKDTVERGVDYKEDGGAGKGKYDYQVASSKENCYRQAFDAQMTPQGKFQRLESMATDLAQSYSTYHKSGVMACKENAKLITDAFKASSQIPPAVKFDNLDKTLAKVTGPGGDAPKPKIVVDAKMQKELDSALRADVKKGSPEMHASLAKADDKKQNTSAMMLSKLSEGKPGFLDKAKAAFTARRKEKIAPAAEPVKQEIGAAAEPIKPEAVAKQQSTAQKTEIDANSSKTSNSPGMGRRN